MSPHNLMNMLLLWQHNQKKTKTPEQAQNHSTSKIKNLYQDSQYSDHF